MGTRFTIPGCPASADLACAPFDVDSLQKWTSWLTSEEATRLSGYRYREDRELFIARHGLAREGIARELSLPPESIRLINRPSGKPGWNANEFSYSETDIDVSLSRTTGMVATAVCRTNCVGVDIEHIHSLPELHTLAIQNLHPTEWSEWTNLPEARRLKAYYRLWVVKEAFAKALGVGLSLEPIRILSKEAMTCDQGKVENTIALEPPQRADFWLRQIEPDKLLSVVVLKRLVNRED
jgi:4'-phosphopantetheinyl transferase